MPRVLKGFAKGSLIPIAAVFVVVLSLSACGSSSGAAVNKNIDIATLFATSGTDGADQLPAQYAVQLAVKQASLPDGYKLGVVTENYEGTSGEDPTIAASEAHTLVGNSSVLAIVGPFNSGAAVAAMPIIQAATLTTISPTNTNPGLTLEQYAASNGISWADIHPSGYPDSYFRTCGNDVVQGSVDAQVATTLGAKTVFVVNDDTTYGVGLATYFTKSFTADGGTTVGTEQAITSGTDAAAIKSLASSIASLNPNFVFYGGVTSGGGALLKKDLVADNYNNPMVGGDGIADDPSFITTAGAAAAVNTYGSVASPDNSQLTTTADDTFASAYNSYVAGLPNNTLLPYSYMAYDVANIEIQAITNVIKSGKAVTRANVRNAVAAINYNGLTGDIYFDANGDNAGVRVFSIYEVDPTTMMWTFKTQVNGS